MCDWGYTRALEFNEIWCAIGETQRALEFSEIWYVIGETQRALELSEIWCAFFGNTVFT